jgi:YHS domain-containing protein
MKKYPVKAFLALVMLLMGSAIQPAAAKDYIYTGSFSDNAVGGYDTVAYFKENKAVKGNEQLKTSYKGADWLFASQENLDLFKASPEKYAPQYGGYCAYAVAEKKQLVSADPTQFSLSNGKLYLNYDEEVKNIWLAKKDAFIRQADTNWPIITR